MTFRSGRASLALWLIWRDLIAEKTMAFCLVAGLTATLAPLLLLAGLRAGFVEGTRQHLLNDPHMREISSASNHSFSQSWLEQMRDTDQVAFLIPRTRTLATSVTITPHNGDAFSTEEAELIATAPGDPLPGREAVAAEFSATPTPHDPTIPAIFSPVLAARLHAQVGDILRMDVTRRSPVLEVAHVPVRVQAITPRNTTDRMMVFVPLGVAQGTEVYRESAPSLSWEASLAQGQQDADQFLNAPAAPYSETLSTQPKPGEKSWPGFRLYATNLENVAQLDTTLASARVTVTDQAGAVGDVLRLDKQTHTLLMLLGSLSVAGFLTTLGSGIWAGVERKRLMLATLRFLGAPLPTLFPIVQGELLALSAVALALALAQGGAQVLNKLFANALPDHHPICQISWALCCEATTLTALCAFLAASVAALKTNRLQPWDGVCSP